MAKRHWIGMAGLHGCMPNASTSYETKRAAAEGLAAMHERRIVTPLMRDGSVELNLKRDGNEYAEIVACSCLRPEDHDA